MREYGKVNSRIRVRVWLGINGSQPASLGRHIGSQSRWKIVSMAVFGIQIGGHPRWGIRATENKSIQIDILKRQVIVNRSVWSIQRGSQPQWGIVLRRQISSHPRRGWRERRESGEGNSRSRVSVKLGSNGRQPEKLGSHIGSQPKSEIVAMEVFGSHIGGHPQWGIRYT